MARLETPAVVCTPETVTHTCREVNVQILVQLCLYAMHVKVTLSGHTESLGGLCMLQAVPMQPVPVYIYTSVELYLYAVHVKVLLSGAH